ncbi:hypothetical protein C9374_003846 [Naegleria lovaniensis]|uniref:14-3-3 domain-containing protein n=1 Tax=Naegleria lovaniensis TaxID=51637 RepID=A0AA88H8I1_NAELO|nr:uncharacterized protein C9374_003846 [Naegleria lovaniensis]KAG2394082.1 hypothetical protein C9374_003846 [Naegleria lovaniensis]
MISEEWSDHDWSFGSVTIRQEESREELIYEAKLLELAECYDDMRVIMKKIIELDSELSTEERNMFSIAYKNVMGSKRLSWRITNSICEKLTDKKEFHQLELAQLYQQNIENEIKEICHELFDLLDRYLIPSATRNDEEDGEAMIFYYKMKGDYHRYLAETKRGDEFSYHSQLALESYKKAISTKSIPASHPLRLGLALNLSVFYYEIMNMPHQACNIAKEAFDEALNELDTLTEDSYKDTTLIMQLLRDGLTLWPSETQEEEEADEE